MFSDLAGRVPLLERLRDGLALRLLVGFLLLAHVNWLCVHLSLVADGRINPWKLGGYGMYTVPNNLAQTHVFLYDDARQAWAPLPNDGANSFNFDTKNYLHVFRCRLPSKESFAAFMDENPHLRYRPLTIALSEQQFSRNPIGATREVYARMEIRWAGRKEFAVRGVVCGDLFEGVVTYQPPS